MPNFRALMTMPADGGDLVRAIREDRAERAEFRDYAVKYPADMLEPTRREMSLYAFERGDHAPPEMREALIQRLTSPAGADAVGVMPGSIDIAHYDSPSNIVAYLPAVTPAPVKRGGWVMHNGGPRIADAKWIKQRTWPPVANRAREATDDEWLWTNPNSCLCVIAYSTDKQCPEWPV